jgi:hypothetical protein
MIRKMIRQPFALSGGLYIGYSLSVRPLGAAETVLGSILRYKKSFFPCGCGPDHANTYALKSVLCKVLSILLGMTRYLR